MNIWFVCETNYRQFLHICWFGKCPQCGLCGTSLTIKLPLCIFSVGTIWRALSKPPQRQQGPDLRPLWLLVGTPSAIITELAFSRAEHSRPYSDVAKYIFDIYYFLTMLFAYWFLLPLRLVWLLVCCLNKEVYLQIFKCVSFWLHGCCGEWEGGPVNQVNHTSWVAVVTPTGRPKSARNCWLIELFCGVVCVVTLPFWHFFWCRGFCHRTGSDLLLFILEKRGILREIIQRYLFHPSAFTFRQKF